MPLNTALISAQITKSNSAYIPYSQSTVSNHYIQSKDNKLVSYIDSLTIALHKGVVTLGKTGKISSMIILLVVMNKTVSDILPSSKKPDTNTNHFIPIPIPVAKFLKTLTSLPENELPLGTIDPESKKRLLEDGVMFWTLLWHANHGIFNEEFS